jgi:CBS domain-containing protein
MQRPLTARDFMARRLLLLTPEMDLHEAMHRLLEHDVSGAPVVDGRGQLVGFLSEKDCFRAAFKGSYFQEPAGRVREYMSPEVETIEADTDVVEVVERFYRSRFRRFPVTAGGRVVGHICRRDVLRVLEDLW